MKFSPNIPARSWALLALTGVAGMLFHIDRQTLAVLKSTLKLEQGWTDTHYSLLVAAFMVPYTLSYLFTGQLVDRWGTRRMMPLFLVLMSVATVLTGLAGGLWTLGACRAILGAASAGVAPAVLVTIITWFPHDQRGTANTFNKPLTVVGHVLVAPLAVGLTAVLGWRWAFIVPGVLGLFAARFWWSLDRNPPLYAGTVSNSRPATYREVFHNRAIRGVLLARVISDPLWFFLIFWQPGFLQEKLGMSLEQFGRVGWIPAASSMGFVMLLGVASDNLIKAGWSPLSSRLRVILLVTALAPATLALPWVGNQALVLVLLTLIHVMNTTWLSMTGLLVSDLVPRGMVGTVVAIMSALGASSAALFNLLAGPLLECVGYTPVLLIGSLLHPAAALILWWNYGRPNKAASKGPAAPQPNRAD